MDDFIKKFDEMVLAANNILIVGHQNPDPDDIGTLISLYNYLTLKYTDKQFTPIIEDSVRLALNYFNDFNQIKWINSLADVWNDSDLVIFVDNSHLDMFTLYHSEISLDSKPTICIDHHKHEPENFRLKYIPSNQASCSQIIYTLFYAKNDSYLNKQSAENILLGILGDTGSLRFISDKNSDVLIIVKELLDRYELDLQLLDVKINSFSKEEIEIINILLANMRTYKLDKLPGLAFSFLNLDILDKYTIDQIKSANDKFKYLFLRKINGFNWGFVITPDSKIRLGIAFRSNKGLPDVKQIAVNLKGGGHSYTSGASFELDKNRDIKDSKDACEKLIRLIVEMNIEMAN